MLDLNEIIFDCTDIGGPRASGYDIIEKYMRRFFADDPRTQADVMKALNLCIHAAIAHDNARLQLAHSRHDRLKPSPEASTGGLFFLRNTKK